MKQIKLNWTNIYNIKKIASKQVGEVEKFENQSEMPTNGSFFKLIKNKKLKE